MTCGYDSRPETFEHAARVGELLVLIIAELAGRAVSHDRSKTQEPELSAFNESTPKLRNSTYGSPEYEANRLAMGPALQHHYDHNAHHPEHYPNGIAGMDLVDLIEMLADWKAATERHTDGNLLKSLEIQRKRFGISDQLLQILWNTAQRRQWLPYARCPEVDPDHPSRRCDRELCGPTWITGQDMGAQGWHWGPHGVSINEGYTHKRHTWWAAGAVPQPAGDRL